jgi:hypothetical protein
VRRADVDNILIMTFVGFVILLIVVVLAIVRSRRRAARRMRAVTMLPLNLVGLPREQDVRADRAIKQARDTIAFNWLEKVPFSPSALYEIAYSVTRDVAAVYYPEAKDPMLKASVKSLMDLNLRIARRINKLLSIPPFNMLGAVELSLIMDIKDGADVVKNHPLMQALLDNPVMDALKKLPFGKIGKALRIARKIRTPMGVALEAGKEITFQGLKRLFVSEIVGIVAEEAMRVYSGRFIRDEKSRTELMILYTMTHFLRGLEDISDEEFRVLIDSAIRLKKLEPELKLFFLGYALKDEHLEEEILEEVIRQSLAADLSGQKRSGEDSERRDERWQRFSEFEEFSPVKSLGHVRHYVTFLEEFCATAGHESQKHRLISRIRQTLKQ